jgi:benzil reductase ((S)-benzoin forming)
MKQAFITGTSRGLGKAMAEELLWHGWNVVGIGRTHTIIDEKYTAVYADLSQLNSANSVNFHFNAEASAHLLINNAGELGTIGYIGNIPSEAFQNGYQLNLISPAILMNRFMELTKPQNSTRFIINISSGAAIEPYDGWGMYSSSKAALDSLTKTLIRESIEIKDNRTFVYSIAPGVVDTSMQELIRKSSKKDFSQLDKFISLHKKHYLTSAKRAADQVLNFVLQAKPLPCGRWDVRDFKTIA